MEIKDQTEKEELALIYKELQRSNLHLRKFVSFKHSFARGVASGFGALVGATVILTAILWFIAQLQFVPLVGNFAIQVVDFVQTNTQYPPNMPHSPIFEPR